MELSLTIQGRQATQRHPSGLSDFRRQGVNWVRLKLCQTFHLSAEARVIYDRGLQAMSQDAGKMLDMAEAVEVLFAEYLACRPLDEQGLEAARAEARQDLAAEQVSDEALLAKCPARDNLEWLATVGAREEERGELRLVVREKPHWKNPLARVPSPVRRRELLRRDGYCCSTPGCPNHLYLETHHIVFFSNEGQTVPENLVVLCASYVTPELCDVRHPVAA